MQTVVGGRSWPIVTITIFSLLVVDLLTLPSPSNDFHWQGRAMASLASTLEDKWLRLINSDEPWLAERDYCPILQ